MAESSESTNKKKPKRPTALKRLIQDKKRNQGNKIFKSRVRTAINAYEKALTQKDAPDSQEKLSLVFSLFDKGVKKGIFKKNLASRKKAGFTKRLQASS